MYGIDKLTPEEVSEKETEVNKRANILKSLSEYDDEARIKNEKLMIGKLIFELFCGHYEKRFYTNKESDIRYKPDEKLDGCISLLESCLRNFNPQKGRNFCAYYTKCIEKRIIDASRKQNKYEFNTVSVDALKSEEDLRDGWDKYSDKMCYNTDDKFSITMEAAEHLNDLLGMILNFSNNHKGKSNNKNKKLWYELFYTEDITRFTKSAEFEEISSHLHERDIFRALRHSYLNFYMSAICESLNEIAWTKLKNYEEILPDAVENEIGKEISSEKMPAKVSLQYLKVCEHITVGNSTRSNQKKFYDEDKKRLL